MEVRPNDRVKLRGQPANGLLQAPDPADHRSRLRGLEPVHGGQRGRDQVPREVLSHTLVLYTQQTGKVVIKEHDRTRQIELRARISKRLLGQERLPLGINRHLGQHFPIPVGMKVEGKPEEGE
jgi:hypothetical protein